MLDQTMHRRLSLYLSQDQKAISRRIRERARRGARYSQDQQAMLVALLYPEKWQWIGDSKLAETTLRQKVSDARFVRRYLAEWIIEEVLEGERSLFSAYGWARALQRQSPDKFAAVERGELSLDRAAGRVKPKPADNGEVISQQRDEPPPTKRQYDHYSDDPEWREAKLCYLIFCEYSGEESRVLHRLQKHIQMFGEWDLHIAVGRLLRKFNNTVERLEADAKAR
jgi:hypothetical protein